MWAREEDRTENIEVVSEWRQTGRMDAQAGHELAGYHSMRNEIENDPFEEEGFDARDYAEYVQGYADYEEHARRNGRSYDEQVEHDAMGGDWIWAS